MNNSIGMMTSIGAYKERLTFTSNTCKMGTRVPGFEFLPVPGTRVRMPGFAARFESNSYPGRIRIRIPARAIGFEFLPGQDIPRSDSNSYPGKKPGYPDTGYPGTNTRLCELRRHGMPNRPKIVLSLTASKKIQ